MRRFVELLVDRRIFQAVVGAHVDDLLPRLEEHRGVLLRDRMRERKKDKIGLLHGFLEGKGLAGQINLPHQVWEDVLDSFAPIFFARDVRKLHLRMVCEDFYEFFPRVSGSSDYSYFSFSHVLD